MYMSLALTGCIWEAYEGAGSAGKPYDGMHYYKPQYEYESYQVADKAFDQSIQNIQRNHPEIFKTHKSFLVASFVNSDNINKSEKAGRVTAMGVTGKISKSAKAQHIRFKRNMLAVSNKIIVPTAEASKAAETFKADAIVMGVYKVSAGNINIRYAFYDAKTRAYLGGDSMLIPIDKTTAQFAYEI